MDTRYLIIVPYRYFLTAVTDADKWSQSMLDSLRAGETVRLLPDADRPVIGWRWSPDFGAYC